MEVGERGVEVPQNAIGLKQLLVAVAYLKCSGTCMDEVLGPLLNDEWGEELMEGP